MIVFSLWKQLKRRLRRNRRPLWMLGSMMLLVSLGCHMIQSPAAVYADGENVNGESRSSIIGALQQKNVPMAVKLQRIYVCGEETELLGRMTSEQIIQLLLEHPEWTAMLDADHESVLLEERIDDLSSHCKSHAYIGVDKNGNLSLFDGEPKEEKVLRTFFQLDVRYMESSLPHNKLEQLTKGIRISDIDEFNSVISTFTDYAMEKNEKVMKLTY